MNFEFTSKEMKQLEFLFKKFIPNAYDNYTADPRNFVKQIEFFEKVRELQTLLKSIDPTLNRYIKQTNSVADMSCKNVASFLNDCFNHEEDVIDQFE